jgi:hypothetical protein
MARRVKDLTQAQGEHLQVAHKLTDAEREMKRAQEQRADAQYKLALLQKGMTEDEAQLLTQIRRAPPALAQEILQLARRTKAITEAREASAQARKEREAEHERFVQQGKDLQAEIRDLKSYGGLAQLKNQFPNESMAALQARYNQQQWRDSLKARAESSRLAEEEDNRVNQAMNQQLKQIQLDAMSEQAKRKYGEVNRESLALESEWNSHYAELAPNQQKIIDQIYELGIAKESQNAQDERARRNAEELTQAITRQKEANIDLQKVLAQRRREQDQAQEEAFNRRMNEWVQEQSDAVQRQQEALTDYANRFASVFTQAFRDVQDGSKSFFQSIVQGFEHMLEEMALEYLQSQLANLFFGLLNNVFGGGNPLGVQPRAYGGPVVPGQRYLVGENGPEMLTMGARGGYVTPGRQMAGAGGPSITYNIMTPDVSGFQRSRGQMMAEAHRESESWRKRNG